jgi:hypothetical protein
MASIMNSSTFAWIDQAKSGDERATREIELFLHLRSAMRLDWRYSVRNDAHRGGGDAVCVDQERPRAIGHHHDLITVLSDATHSGAHRRRGLRQN